MNTALHNGVLLDAREGASLSDLSRACGVPTHDLEDLVEYGALTLLPAQHSEPLFSAEYLMPLRTAGKMRIDYDFDIFTVILLLGGLKRVEILERKICRLELLLPTDAALSFYDGVASVRTTDR